MDVSKLPIFESLSERLRWLGQRQNVLAQNIANLNTPGYSALDLRETDFARMVGRSHRKLTLASSGGSALGSSGLREEKMYQVVPDPTPGETTPSGNGVMLEDQLKKVSDTQADYQTAISLYNKHLSLIRMALGVR